MVRIHRLGWLVATAAVLAGCASGPTSPPAQRDQIAFGIAMAERGLWSEALFRFEQAARSSPGDPRILNNLAVAHEALGNFDAALESYRAALALAPGNSELMSNYDRFASFYESFRVREEAELAAAVPEPEANEEPPGNGGDPVSRPDSEEEGMPEAPSPVAVELPLEAAEEAAEEAPIGEPGEHPGAPPDEAADESAEGSIEPVPPEAESEEPDADEDAEGEAEESESEEPDPRDEQGDPDATP